MALDIASRLLACDLSGVRLSFMAFRAKPAA